MDNKDNFVFGNKLKTVTSNVKGDAFSSGMVIDNLFSPSSILKRLPGRGKVIVVEGLDGSYKSTTAEKLVAKMNDAGIPTILARQPGGTPIAEQMRNIIVAGNQEGEELTAYSEMCLALAARAQLYTNVVYPAIGEGKCVVLDRGDLSTLGYQSYNGLPLGYIQQQLETAPWWSKADMMATIHIPHKVGTARIDSRYAEDGKVPPTHLEERLEHCEKVYDDYDISMLANTHLSIPYKNSDGVEWTSTDIANLIFQALVGR